MRFPPSRFAAPEFLRQVSYEASREIQHIFDLPLGIVAVEVDIMSKCEMLLFLIDTETTANDLPLDELIKRALHQGSFDIRATLQSPPGSIVDRARWLARSIAQAYLNGCVAEDEDDE